MRSWMAIFKTKQLRTGSVSLPSYFMFGFVLITGGNIVDVNLLQFIYIHAWY